MAQISVDAGLQPMVLKGQMVGQLGDPTAKWAPELFESAALDAWRTNRGGLADPHRLGRVPILRSDSPFFFRAKVQGRLDTEAWAYRALRPFHRF
jgi:hypothetical protein